MRKMKKLLCAVLTSAMVFAMAAPSFADTTSGQKGTITINTSADDNGVQERTYTAYQIFSLESSSGSNYAYKVNPEWQTFVATYAVDGELVFTLNNDGYLIENKLGEDDSEVAKAFAKAALANAAGKNGTSIPSGKDGTAVWEDVPLGYYLIDSTVGTLCMLNTNAPDITITDKNVAPTITKSLKGEADQVVQIGQEANFRIVVDAKEGGEKYIIHDEMSESLTFNKNTADVKVYQVTDMDADDAKTADMSDDDIVTNYSVETGTTDECTFEIRFNDGFAVTADCLFVVDYKATVNNKAIDIAPSNTARLTYGDGGDTLDTPPVEPKTNEFDLQKTDTNGNELSGAQFSLYTTEKGTDAIEFVQVAAEGTEGEADYKPGYYRVATDEDTTTTTIIEVGMATIKGLDNTEYWLEEKVAPQGYNMLSTRTSVTPGESGVLKTVENSTGALLPSTGGIGTTIFYAAGIILMAGAVFFVVRRKRA